MGASFYFQPGLARLLTPDIGKHLVPVVQRLEKRIDGYALVKAMGKIVLGTHRQAAYAVRRHPSHPGVQAIGRTCLHIGNYRNLPILFSCGLAHRRGHIFA